MYSKEVTFVFENMIIHNIKKYPMNNFMPGMPKRVKQEINEKLHD